MIKDDQGAKRNPYKCMNVMKQDAKHVKNNACKRISTDREAVEQLSSKSQPQWIKQLSSIYREDRKFLDGQRIYREAIDIAIKKAQKGSIDSLAVERCPAAVEIA